MEARTIWTGKMQFNGECNGHSVGMDAKPPFGDNAGFTPKELLAIAVAGCTGMDVVSLMKKHKQPLESLEIKVVAPTVENKRPPVFKEIFLTFLFKGQLDKDKVVEAVHLSQTKYCAVSAMLSPSIPIFYKILLNDEEVGTDDANFE